jgi:Tol biopolymer transport system component
MTAGKLPTMDAQLFVMDADGQNEKSLGKGQMAVWSPDGKQILYNDPIGSVLWVMDADGKNAKQLFQTPSRMRAYSPDGKRIAYVCVPRSVGPATQFAGAGFGGGGRQPPTRIYVANADGSGAAPVTTAEPEASDSAPRWSADGKRIYFNRMPEKDRAGRPANVAYILAIDPDGKNEKELVKTDALDLLGSAVWQLRLP